MIIQFSMFNFNFLNSNIEIHKSDPKDAKDGLIEILNSNIEIHKLFL